MKLPQHITGTPLKDKSKTVATSAKTVKLTSPAQSYRMDKGEFGLQFDQLASRLLGRNGTKILPWLANLKNYLYDFTGSNALSHDVGKLAHTPAIILYCTHQFHGIKDVKESDPTLTKLVIGDKEAQLIIEQIPQLELTAKAKTTAYSAQAVLNILHQTDISLKPFRIKPPLPTAQTNPAITTTVIPKEEANRKNISRNEDDLNDNNLNNLDDSDL